MISKYFISLQSLHATATWLLHIIILCYATWLHDMKLHASYASSHCQSHLVLRHQSLQWHRLPLLQLEEPTGPVQQWVDCWEVDPGQSLHQNVHHQIPHHVRPGVCSDDLYWYLWCWFRNLFENKPFSQRTTAYCSVLFCWCPSHAVLRDESSLVLSIQLVYRGLPQQVLWIRNDKRFGRFGQSWSNLDSLLIPPLSLDWQSKQGPESPGPGERAWHIKYRCSFCIQYFLHPTTVAYGKKNSLCKAN